MAIHFCWDFWIGLPEATSELATFRRMAAVSLMAIATLMFGVSVFYGVRWSKAIIAPRSQKRLWGWPFSLLFRGRSGGSSEEQ